MAIANSLIAAPSVLGRGLSMTRSHGIQAMPNAGATKTAIRANSGTAVQGRQSQRRRLRSRILRPSPSSRSLNRLMRKLRTFLHLHNSRVSSSGASTVRTSPTKIVNLLKTANSALILGLLVIQTDNDPKRPSADANLLVSQIEKEFCRDWEGNRDTTNKRMN